MKLISWNVNGLRACLTHGFAESFAQLDADIFSVQETKMQPGQADFAPDGYTEYTYSAEKKGYSGTACWCREAPGRNGNSAAPALCSPPLGRPRGKTRRRPGPHRILAPCAAY